MSWLYTIIFAGVLFSSDAETSQQPVVDLQGKPHVVQSQTDDVVEKFEQTYPLNANGRVSVSNVSGPIVVEAWDRNEVRLEFIKIADSRETLAQFEIEIDARPEYLRVETEHKQWNFGDSERNKYRKMEVHFRLQVPRRAVLSEIEAVNGSVTVSNFTNITKVSAVNGSVNATNLRGTAKLSTVNGEVRANFDRLDPGAAVSLETVNGKLNLEVPSDVNATIRAESLNGSISNDFGLPVKKGKYVGRNLHGRLGTGDVRISLESVNGGMSIIRKKDGRNPAPVVNLLQMTDSDDDDSDENFSRNERVDRNIEVSVNKSAKATDKGLKEKEKGLKEKQKIVEQEKLAAGNLAEVSAMLNSKEIKRAVADGMRRQTAAVAQLNDAFWNRQPTSVERRFKTFDVKSTPKVSIDAPQCKVRVHGWDQPVVKYVLTEGRTNRDTPMTVTENATDKTIFLRISGNEKPLSPGFFGHRVVVRLEVFVPRTTDIRVNTNEEIRVEGVTGNIELVGNDEPVNVRDSEGTLKLSSADGLVRVVGFRGDLDLKTTDAEVYLEGDFAKISSVAEDACITLTLPANKDASISTNAAIESEGLNVVREDGRTWRLGKGGPRYNFEFADGTLTVRNLSSIDTN